MKRVRALLLTKKNPRWSLPIDQKSYNKMLVQVERAIVDEVEMVGTYEDCARAALAAIGIVGFLKE